MKQFSATSPAYLVFHGADGIPPVLVDYLPPDVVVSAHTTVEPFVNPQDAIDRALELGCSPLDTQVFWPHDKTFNAEDGRLYDLPVEIPVFDPEADYPAGSVVRYSAGEPAPELLFLKAVSGGRQVPDLEQDAIVGKGDWTLFVQKPAPPPPPPPEPRWVQFGLSLGQDPAVNQFVAAASAAAPVLERMISGSLLQAAEGNLRTFLPAWKAAIDAGLVAPGLAQHLQAMAGAHDLPAEFVAGLNPPPEAP